MADQTRQSWSDILSEFIHRAGMNDETASDFPDRARTFLTSAYLDVCLLWHHFELDTVDDTRDFVVGDLGITLPNNLYSLFAVDIFTPDPERCFIHTLEFEEAHVLITGKESKSGQPTKYTRFENKILVERCPDLAYGTEIYYYRMPDPPDFDSTITFPETHWLWDNHIIEAALAISHGAVWRPDLGQMNLQSLAGFASSSAQPPLSSKPLHPQPERPTRTTPHGGAQG